MATVHPATPWRLAYRIPEAAQALGISRSHLYNMISRREVAVVKIGGSAVRIPSTEVQRLAGVATPPDAA